MKNGVTACATTLPPPTVEEVFHIGKLRMKAMDKACELQDETSGSEEESLESNFEEENAASS